MCVAYFQEIARLNNNVETFRGFPRSHQENSVRPSQFQWDNDSIIESSDAIYSTVNVIK
jgi:hypothetical protein